MAHLDRVPPRQWPYPVDLSDIAGEARELFAAHRTGTEAAPGKAARNQPNPDPPNLTLRDTRDAVARSYGFPDWSRVERYFRTVESHSRSPNVDPTPSKPSDGTGFADDFIRLACLTQGAQDHPSRRARARSMLDAHPELARMSIYAAAAAGDIPAVSAFLNASPELAKTPGGPHDWEPLLYVAFSRLDAGTSEHAAVETARLLLAHGADPNAGYLWAGFPCPYTVLTGLFGEGENGPARCPPHRNCYELAEILIEAGADPNDAQTLYNRMFSRDDEHLRFLFAHGLGKDGNRPWHRLLGEQSRGWVSSPADMLAYQMQWAARWNYPDRVRLLVENGADVNRPSNRPGARSPYGEAVYHGNEAIAEYLAACGARTFPLDDLDRFACACISGDRDRARALLALDPMLIEKLGDRVKALMENALGSDNRDAVRLMDQFGFDLNACGMHEAARYGHLDMIKLMVELGADPSHRDGGHGIDAIGHASHYQQDHVVEYLAQFAGIHRAVKSDLLARVRDLLENDPAHARKRDESGNTPLHVLDVDNRMEDTEEILQLLVAHGAEVNARNQEGLTPLDRLERLAGFSRRDDLAELLRGYGGVGSDAANTSKDRPVS
ncbi:MAG: ankyrin repeat domain-containing protein [Gemmatimonadetes bacterium]|nr:ankyrin repeat domain-containing protein [Gemmatimonadota bacterium]MYB61097.1 ankyrin repeat domain-containing protein [Gemmatimonadota bacterium]